MNPYLEKLKRAAEKGPPQELSKLPKAPFDSFGSCLGTPFSPERAEPIRTNECLGAADFEERAAISEHDGGLSRAHAETLASLQAMAVPDGVTAAQVSVVIDAAARFLDRKKGVQ